MNCIQSNYSPLVLPFLSNSIQKPQWRVEKLPWSSSKEPSRIVKRSQKATTRTRAIEESLILGVTSRARPGDVSVLLQTGLVSYIYEHYSAGLIQEIEYVTRGLCYGLLTLVFLCHSAVLLFMYVIANFVFPAFITKYYEWDEISEDAKPRDDVPSDDE
ncbi:unnamed protein product [Dovyalis caffra]|uniref:Uncharacterized protein n=1 Tax=Dovyalis caffra TaxID=77055 RepID=A0AAV1RSE0_9ROSI|nr:unnamed protein product [Dovyalis caffra]